MHCSSVILSVALALCSTAVVAVPAPQVTAAPLAADLAKRATSCTFSGSAGAAAASKSKASCATIVLSSVAVPSGTTLDLTGLKAGTHVVFEGTTTFGYKEWAGPLVSVAGTDVVVTGAAGSLLDGGGSRWWDGEGTNGGKTKPKFFYAHKLLGKSSISNINIKNSPVQVFSINGADGLTLTNVHIDNTAGDNGGGHNTDCFDVGSSNNVQIIGTSPLPLDCLAINSGTDITFSGGTCSGGHGLSIGSVGGRDDNTVNGVVIENSKISNSQNGVRIKTVSGATGSVKAVTYKGITLSNITKYGIPEPLSAQDSLGVARCYLAAIRGSLCFVSIRYAGTDSQHPHYSIIQLTLTSITFRYRHRAGLSERRTNWFANKWSAYHRLDSQRRDRLSGKLRHRRLHPLCIWGVLRLDVVRQQYVYSAFCLAQSSSLSFSK
ncbi:Polygalacturonase 1 [Elasticomyces elasticus]|nr:Polygalacturonase 1 [Elasticomyces elasticus]